MMRRWSSLAVAAAAMALAAGCHNQSQATLARPAGAESLAKQLTDIDDNPVMPPQAKQAAKDALMRGAAIGQRAGK